MVDSYTSTHIVQITDTTDDNARLKIESAYVRHLGRCGLRDAFFRVVGSPNTLDIGIKASELVHNTERPDRLLLALNCAPPDKKDGTEDNHRKDFFFAKLKNQVFAGGTLNGFELSYLKDEIQELYRLTTTNDRKSQFRSLEILPEHIIRFANEELRAELIKNGSLEEIRNIDTYVASIPDQTHVIEVDNFKNVKLFTSSEDRRKLSQLQDRETEISFGESLIDQSEENLSYSFNGVVKPTLFAAPEGTNILALNSSSKILGDQQVPIIATVRSRPAETLPNYKIPNVGQIVQLNAA